MHIALVAALVLGVVPLTTTASLAGADDGARNHARRQSGPMSYPMTLHHARHEQGLEKRAGTAAGKLPITNANYGKAWSIPIEIGTPPQKVNALLRSDIPEVFIFPQCDPATDISNCSDPVTGLNGTIPYDPTASSSYKNMSREVLSSFQLIGGGTRGSLFTDTVSVGAGGSRADQAMFIEKHNETIDFSFLTKRPGITAMFGLGWPLPKHKVSPPVDGIEPMNFTVDGDSRPYWKYLADEVWAKPEFSIWIAEHTLTPDPFFTQVPNAGQITLGGANPDMYTGEFNYVDAVNGSSWNVALDGIKVNGESIDITTTNVAGFKGANTTHGNTNDPNAPFLEMRMDTYIWFVSVPNDVADRIYAKIPGAVQRNVSTLNSDTATFIGPDDVHPASVPCDTNATISLTFNGIDYTLLPKHYVAVVGQDQCLSLVLGWSTGVIGLPFFQPVYTSFRSSPNQVGFATVSPTAADMVQNGNNEGSINSTDNAQQSSDVGGSATASADAVSQSGAKGSGGVTGMHLPAAGVVLAVAAIAVSVL